MSKIVLFGICLGLSCIAPAWAEETPNAAQAPAAEASSPAPANAGEAMNICDYVVVPLVKLFEIASQENPEGANLEQVTLPVDGKPQVVGATYKNYLGFFENSPVKNTDGLCNKQGL